jgi:hypothetical protein
MCNVFMKTYLLLAFFCFTCLLISCIRKKSPDSSTLKDQFSHTADFAIIPLDSVGFGLFDSLHMPTELSVKELSTLDSLLKVFIDDSEGVLSKDKVGHPKIDLSKHNYKKQYVPAITSNGQKKVWVNFLCSTSLFDWRHKIILVDDGGDCYFNVLINLSDKSYSYFIVNGKA